METDNKSAVLDADRTYKWLSQPQDQLLVLGAPADADVDLISEAYLAFAEYLFDIDTCDEDHAIWSAVPPEAFDAAVRNCLEKTSGDPKLQGIWADGQLAIVAPQGLISPSKWSILQELLETTHSDMQIGAGAWPLLADPTAPLPGSDASRRATPAATRPEPRSDVSLEQVARANRHLPVPATPEQQSYLALQAAQPNGQPPSIAMTPVILEMPDKEALRATIEALQERHESLFTAFVTHDHTPFLVLNDSAPLPLDRARILNPVSSIAARAEQKTRELARSLHESGGHWRACLIEGRRQAAVAGVFSKTIADQSAVHLFRKELITFYDAFRAGRNPEVETTPPALQYTDFAASERDSTTAVAWWEQLLPSGLFAEAVPALPFVAPVNRWQQNLPSELTKQLLTVAGGDKSTLEALLLSAFLQSLSSAEKAPPSWFTLPVHDLRPAGAEGCLGQFTRLCPVWVQDMAKAFDPQNLAARLAELRAHCPLGHRDLALALPGRIPARIPYFFELTTHHAQENDLEQQEDFSLVVRQASDQLTAHWAIRLDHPQCHRHKKIGRAFCAHLSELAKRQHNTKTVVTASRISPITAILRRNSPPIDVL